ncbi:MAG: nucleotide exchange factor GrpE [Cyanobacteria bacterium]|nr:nucleotide exchange factor GrpE [Cyanobacteriota bacterium]MDW8202498.1 nucleotide exchange factor GrpE [Cyanobacteriota bacterium SKYGB_h_bin112]
MTDSDNQQGSEQQPADEPSIELSDASSDISAQSMQDMSVSSSDNSESEPSPTDDAEQVAEAQDDAGKLQRLESEIAELKAQLEERTNLYIRLQADFDNFRKRTQREKEELDLQVKCSTIAELLPVVDNFDRARSQLKPQTEEATNIHKSYQGVYKQLVDCLKRIGVSPMRSEGQEFDPSLHEAVIREPTDQYPEGTVIEELVRGYVLGEKVLRHAMVKVATAPESSSSSTDSEE